MNCIYSICYGEDKIWLFDEDAKSIFSANIYSGVIQFEIMLDLSSSKNHSNYFVDIKYYDGKVILIPGREESIFIYDTEKKQVSQIEIDQNYKGHFTSIYAFINSVILGECLYLIPYTYVACVKMNLNDMSIEYIPFDNRFGCNKGLYSRGISLSEKEILLLSRESNNVQIFNVDSYDIKTVCVGRDDTYFLDACLNDGIVYLVDNTGNIIEWNYKSENSTIIFNYTEYNIPTVDDRKPVNDRRLLFADNSIWLFDFDYMPVRLNLEKKSCDVIDKLIFEDKGNDKYLFVYAEKKDKQFILYSKCIESIVLFDYKKDYVNRISLNITKELDDNILKGFIELICR